MTKLSATSEKLWAASIGIALLSGCSGGEIIRPVVPTLIEVGVGLVQTAAAGLPLPVEPTFTVKDRRGTILVGIPVTVTVTAGGGTLLNPPTVSSEATPVGQWTLGRIAGQNTITVSAAGLPPKTITVSGVPGALSALSITGGGQTGLAGTAVAQPIRVRPEDQFGNVLQSQTATLSVVGGGGALASQTAQSGPDGTITLPTWTMGKFALPQSIQVSIGTISAVVNAEVQTNYSIDLRFWGPPMTNLHRALFTMAAARIRAIVVGSVVATNLSGFNPAICGVTGFSTLNESTNGLVIYASVQNIDGPGEILAFAGPCIYNIQSQFPVVGTMRFDAADMNVSEAELLDTIIHEMLHVLGVGSDWNKRGLLVNFNTSNVAYIGAGGVAGCLTTGAACPGSAPVENIGGPGTANSHWRESIFGDEMMTGFADPRLNPISAMTVRALGDLGYGVNLPAGDAFTVTGSGLRENRLPGRRSQIGVPWEMPLGLGPYFFPAK